MDIRPRYIQYLSYINSNKFITPNLFKLKFIPQAGVMGAVMRLRRMTQIGLLVPFKNAYHSEPVYHLTGNALKVLKGRGEGLIKYPTPPRISLSSLEHDTRVTRLRVAFEETAGLKDVFWVSDHEMKSGITPKMKAEFEAGRLDLPGWLKESKGKKAFFRRCPDAYFEATVGADRLAFILEYVHKEYFGIRFDEVIVRLASEYPNARKMIVFRTEEAARRFIPVLQKKITKKEPWYVGDYERAVKLPFTKIWHHLTEPIG